MSSDVPKQPFVASAIASFVPDRIFPQDALGRADYILAAVLIAFCFVFFFQHDVLLIGACSLNYLFGPPLDFYENCVRFNPDYVASCPYPPSTYALFAIWMLPFKLLGVVTGPEHFPIYLAYWLKVLTTICYFGSALVFRKILLEYSPNVAWATYATLVWLAAPLGIFSQFIFSQSDIFHVFLTLLGFLMFARKRLGAASAFFGIAITFKYFPAFVFLPLLLFSEKNIARLMINGLIFIMPIALVNVAYHASPAYSATVNNYFEVSRVYSAILDVGGWQVYLLFGAFMVLCGVAYATAPTEDRRLPRTAYLWLAGSILPFLFVVWHPQWLIFVPPAIVLSSMLSHAPERFMVLDLAGMLMFVGVCAVAFPINVDAAMFRGELFGMHFDHGFLMRRLFDWFNGHSRGVYLSAFSGYLTAQLVLKARSLFWIPDAIGRIPSAGQYDSLRFYFYAGLGIFLIPAGIALSMDKARNEFFVANYTGLKSYAQMLDAPRLEQTFVAREHVVARVFLPLYAVTDSDELARFFGGGEASLELVDASGEVLASSKKPMATFGDSMWQEFEFPPARLLKGQQYKLRLVSPTAVENRPRWFASAADSYPEGYAVVDGVKKDFDMTFRIGFARSRSAHAP